MATAAGHSHRLGGRHPGLWRFRIHLPQPIGNLAGNDGLQDHHPRPRLAHLLGHHGRLWHRHCRRRAARRADRQLAPRLRRPLPADDRLQRATQSRFRADSGRLVWHWHRPGDPHRFPDFLFPDHGQYRHGTSHPRTGTGRRAARTRRDPPRRADQGRAATHPAVLFWLAQDCHHPGLCRHHRFGNDGIQRRHRLPADLRRLVDAHGAGFQRPADRRPDGHGDVRAVQHH